MTPIQSQSPACRWLAVGDIHGCLAQLTELMERVKPTSADRVVFLGDYVDRGPDSAGVIDYLIEFAAIFPKTVFLRGNHEQMFLDYLDGQDSAMFLINGGRKTLDSYRDRRMWPIPTSHRRFFESLEHSFESEHHIFVHAGLRPGIPLAEQADFDMLWIRHEFLESDFDWGKAIVYGHTPRQEPLLGDHRIGVDTGCVYGRQLTCCEVVTQRIWQV
ncbi:MAG: metallophosphoesterase family protein [Desulfuromonadales bacterium]